MGIAASEDVATFKILTLELDMPAKNVYTDYSISKQYHYCEGVECCNGFKYMFNKIGAYK